MEDNGHVLGLTVFANAMIAVRGIFFQQSRVDIPARFIQYLNGVQGGPAVVAFGQTLQYE